MPRAVVFDAYGEGEAPAEPNYDGGSAGASPSRLTSLSFGRGVWLPVAMNWLSYTALERVSK